MYNSAANVAVCTSSLHHGSSSSHGFCSKDDPLEFPFPLFKSSECTGHTRRASLSSPPPPLSASSTAAEAAAAGCFNPNGCKRIGASWSTLPILRSIHNGCFVVSADIPTLFLSLCCCSSLRSTFNGPQLRPCTLKHGHRHTSFTQSDSTTRLLHALDPTNES